MSPAEEILATFERINAVPRCSGKERAIADWLQTFAADRGWACQRDGKNNVLIRIHGTGRLKSAPPVALQGHLDMVCEKTPDSTHDFDRDPIVSYLDGDWLTADRTTLGADNGIAIAIALTVGCLDTVHPPLELVFTADEESGLTGAQALQPDWLQSRRLINIDSEDEGVFTIGCAGGLNTILTVPLSTESAPGNLKYRRVTVSGLLGGHSGVDIHLDRANANVLLARTWHRLCDGRATVVGTIEGGSAHNAIPRDASMVLGVKSSELEKVTLIIDELRSTFRNEYGSTDPDLDVLVTDADRPVTVLETACAKQVRDLILALPNGVLRMSRDVEGLVETSTNLATIRVKDKRLEINTSQRSSNPSQLEAASARVAAFAGLVSGTVSVTARYPPWQPQPASSLLAVATDVYRKCFDRAPTIEVVHAGLECGVIGEKYPGMEMLSIGPTIQMPHSPDERLNVPSLHDFWTFLVELLAALR